MTRSQLQFLPVRFKGFLLIVEFCSGIIGRPGAWMNAFDSSMTCTTFSFCCTDDHQSLEIRAWKHVRKWPITPYDSFLALLNEAEGHLHTCKKEVIVQPRTMKLILSLPTISCKVYSCSLIAPPCVRCRTRCSTSGVRRHIWRTLEAGMNDQMDRSPKPKQPVIRVMHTWKSFLGILVASARRCGKCKLRGVLSSFLGENIKLIGSLCQTVLSRKSQSQIHEGLFFHPHTVLSTYDCPGLSL